ncbi:MAG: hypothetical protein ACJA1B_000109 [Polaribacter sp.]|jgi:hypothetical protein
MILNLRNLLLILCIIALSSCSSFNTLFMKESDSFKENFDDLEKFKKDWVNNSWKSPASYTLENKHLKITTRAKTTDRIKVRTQKKRFTTGVYKWRIFVPKFPLV